MALLDFLKKRKEIDRFLNKRKTKAKDIYEKNKFVDVSLRKESAYEAQKENEIFKKDENYNILKSPHITEKSSKSMEKGIYVFKINQEANKIMVKKALKDFYGVRARKINIVNIHRKEKFVRGKWGKKPGFKKAVVYLEKGEKMEI